MGTAVHCEYTVMLREEFRLIRHPCNTSSVPMDLHYNLTIAIGLVVELDTIYVRENPLRRIRPVSNCIGYLVGLTVKTTVKKTRD